MHLYSLNDWFGEWLVHSMKRAYRDWSCWYRLGWLLYIFYKSWDLIGGIFGYMKNRHSFILRSQNMTLTAFFSISFFWCWVSNWSNQAVLITSFICKDKKGLSRMHGVCAVAWFLAILNGTNCTWHIILFCKCVVFLVFVQFLFHFLHPSSFSVSVKFLDGS